ncbi:fimbria/pilus outer membrane usher protein [Vibrio splendidus]|uniref:fimbria/pilus outer membrane usher protein n=1 Tax=Vibrio splendidus TaxID=29497 RepID=UPI0022356B8B|nr:fimbria/pilus outer membrane usher protein [Vibrio splendidus]MCW4438859.1 fimbria/pilus outer membrane usher protein [Vibrio splendidus]
MLNGVKYLNLLLFVLLTYEVNASSEYDLDLSFVNGVTPTLARQLMMDNEDVFGTPRRFAVVVNGRGYGKHVFRAIKLKDKPCFPTYIFKEYIFDNDYYNKYSDDENECIILDEKVGATYIYEKSSQKVTISLPQISKKKSTYEIGNIQFGQNGINARYNVNVRNTVSDELDYYASLDARLNYDKWRFEIDGYYSGESVEINNAVAKRVLPKIGSNLSIGNVFLPSTLVDSFSFNGVLVSTENRFEAKNLYTYSPTINEIANTNARVEISQSGRVLISEVVPPGPFEFDRYGLVSNGDVILKIYEENGEVREFIYPVSTLPSLKAVGSSELTVAFGDNSYLNQGQFIYSDYYYGHKLGTLSFSGLLGSDYQNISSKFASSLGRLGALSLGMSASLTDDVGMESKRLLGMRYSTEYRKSLTDDTDFVFLNLGYQDMDYRSFSESDYDLSVYRPKNDFSINLSHRFSASVSGSFSGYKRSYWNSEEQLGMNATLSTSIDKASITVMGSLNEFNGYQDWQVNIGLSLPLGDSGGSQLYTSIVSTKEGQSYSSSYSSVLQKNTSYGVSANYDTTQTLTNSANISHQFEKTKFSGSVTSNNFGTGWSSSLSGSLLKVSDSPLHFSPNRYDSVLLVELDDEKGVRFNNGNERTDSNGVVATPLSEYSLNNKYIDTKSLGIRTELEQLDFYITPTRSALFYKKVNVRHVYPILLSLESEHEIPIGSKLKYKNVEIGEVGLGGMAFVSVDLEKQAYSDIEIEVFNLDNFLCEISIPIRINQSHNESKVDVENVNCE